MAKTSGLTARKPNGKIIKANKLERIKNEKGIYLEEKSASKIIIHLDAYDLLNLIKKRKKIRIFQCWTLRPGFYIIPPESEAGKEFRAQG